MNTEQFRQSLQAAVPPTGWPAPLAALWWDANGNWAQAHAQVDDLETRDAMAVHAYLHRKEGSDWNAEYWYKRAGTQWRRENLQDEWEVLVEALLAQSPSAGE